MKSKKDDVSIVRSSAAEYLTFVASTGDDKSSIEMRYEDENIWLTQKMLAVLYDVTIAAVNQHLKKIYADGELTETATVKKFLIVQDEGGRKVSRDVAHYSLQAIIAVGFKVNNERAVQFRKWAKNYLTDHTAAIAKAHALCEFEKFRIVQDHLYQSDFDRMMLSNADALTEASDAKPNECGEDK